jgi:hypothetical protein
MRLSSVCKTWRTAAFSSRAWKNIQKKYQIYLTFPLEGTKHTLLAIDTPPEKVTVGLINQFYYLCWEKTLKVSVSCRFIIGHHPLKFN